MFLNLISWILNDRYKLDTIPFLSGRYSLFTWNYLKWQTAFIMMCSYSCNLTLGIETSYFKASKVLYIKDL